MATVFKRVSSTMLAISLCVPLLACSTPSANSANNSSSTESTSEAPANTNSEGQVASISGGASITSGSSTSGTSVGIGDTINTSSIDFRILDAAFTDYIQSPSYSTGRYEYYTPDDGMVFVDVVAEITNKKDHPLNNPASVKAVYAEKYNYSANMMYEDENGGFDYPSLTSIDPLTTKVAHFMLSVPQEAQESTQPFTILITAKGSSERYVLALR